MIRRNLSFFFFNSLGTVVSFILQFLYSFCFIHRAVPGFSFYEIVFLTEKFPFICFVSAVAWCGKLNAIACASETCARIPR